MSEYINNIIYGIKSFLSGMQLTFKHFKNKKDLVATLQYPREKWPQPERNIGFDHSEYNEIRSRLHVDIDDCIGCLQCERACPVDCIKIDTIKPPKDSEYDCGMTSNDTQKKMIVPRFTIDMSECMYCNLCVYPCPEDCIYMVGGPNEDKHEMDYEFSQYERHGLIYEFATATDQDIIDIGGSTYLEEKKEKEARRNAGESLQGVVTSEAEGDDVATDSPKKLKDPLLEIFNIVPDKVARGIAKKATVFGKRNKLDYSAMGDEVEKRITAAGKSSDEMTNAINNLKAYIEPESSNLEDKTIEKDVAISPDPAKTETASFNVKSLDFIEDKMIRGVAKKAFMAAKRANLDDNNKIDEIIKVLTEANKINDDIVITLTSFKSETTDTTSPNEKSIEEKPTLFDIKCLNDIEDKMIRGSSKKIYMAGKRAGHTTEQVIQQILDELNDKLDEATLKLLKDIN